MSWFNRIAKTCQMPMVLSQMGEDVFLSRAGELVIDPNVSAPITAVVRVTSQEATTQNGQAMIERAEVLLPVHADEYEPAHPDEYLLYDGKIEKLTTAHIILLRGQIFSIESIGSEDGGFRKLMCKARKSEVTNRSTLNGRL